MKRKKDQENRVSEVCEPRATYNSAVPCAETATVADTHSLTAMPDDCMSVEEYFNKLKTMVNEYYENIRHVGCFHITDDGITSFTL